MKPLAPNEKWIGEGVVCQDLNWSRELRSLGILGELEERKPWVSLTFWNMRFRNS